MRDATGVDPLEILRNQEKRLQRIEKINNIDNAKQYDPATIGLEDADVEDDGDFSPPAPPPPAGHGGVPDLTI